MIELIIGIILLLLIGYEAGRHCGYGRGYKAGYSEGRRDGGNAGYLAGRADERSALSCDHGSDEAVYPSITERTSDGKIIYLRP